MTLVVGKLLPRRARVIPAVVFILLGAALALWLGPAPTPHHVTRDMAVKIAVTHLLQPADEHTHVQAKLVRQWQLTLVSPNDGGHIWTNELIWLVLVPGGHFSAAGCCAPAFSWNVALVNDHAGFAQLDGVIAGSHSDGPLWYRLLPDLSGGGQ